MFVCLHYVQTTRSQDEMVHLGMRLGDQNVVFGPYLRSSSTRYLLR